MQLLRVSFAVGLFVALLAPLASADASAADVPATPTALVVVGDAGASELASVKDEFARVLQAIPWKLADPAALADPDVAQIRACLSVQTPWPCVSTVISAKGIARVVVVEVNRDKKGAQIALLGELVAGSINVAPYSSTFCPLARCTDTTLRNAANVLAKQLVQEAHDFASGSEHPRSPPQQSPTPPPPHPAARPRSLALPIALVSVGGAAILGGLVALPFDEHDSPTVTTRRYYYSTLAPGIAAIAAGAVAGAVGGILWWRFRRHSSTAPAVAVTPGGAVFGLQGAF